MQSKLHSWIEVFANVVSGYVIAIASQVIIFPYFGIHISLGENMLMGLFFTVVSIIRSYFFRRLFNKLSSKPATGK